MNDMTPAPISVERLREIVAFLLGEGELDGHSFGDGFAPLVAGKYPAAYWWRTQLRERAAVLPALLHQLAERDAEVALLRARETDLQSALYRWLPHITPFSPEIQGDDCNLLIGLMEPVGPELGESIRQRAIAAERARKECVRLAEKWERISSTHGVRCFTGDDHLIFANELRVAIGQQPAAASGGDRP